VRLPNTYERLLISRFLIPGAGGRLALLIAAIGFAGVTIGVASLVLVISFMNGAEARLAGQIASADGHIFVSGSRFGIKHPAQLERALAKIDGVEAATASLNGAALIGVNGRVFSADLQGLTPSSMAKSPVFRGKAAMLIGTAPIRPGTLALGSDLATRLGVVVGEHAAISTIRNDNGELGLANYDFIVSSIVRTDDLSFDSERAIMPVDDLRRVLDSAALAAKVSVRLRKPTEQNTVLSHMRHQLASGYTFATWKSMNTVLFAALAQEKLAMTVIISMVTLIALSNILSSMVMLIRYKSREIAILRTMGMSKKSVVKVFVGVGAIIGLAGEVAGLGVGLSLKVAKDPIAQALRTQFSHPPVELDVLLSLPLVITGTEIAWIVALVSGGVILSTLYPAIRASAIDPATVLRYT